MITFKGMSEMNLRRKLGELLEPFIVKRLQKEHHTFFLYRCADFQSFEHMCECHKFEYDGTLEIIQLVEYYWSAIDILKIDIVQMPKFELTRTYFAELERLERTNKTISGFTFFEVKLKHNFKPVTLSVRTKEFVDKAKTLGYKCNYAHVYAKGDMQFSYDVGELNPQYYRVYTHTERKNYPKAK